MRMAESLANLRLLGRRAWLALLGIAVGCAAVVGLLDVGHSAAQQARQVFRGMGSEFLVAHLSDTGGLAGQPVQLPPLAALPAVRLAAPLAIAQADVRAGAVGEAVMVAASTPALAEVLGLEAAQGRLLGTRDRDATHALLGAGLAERLAAEVGETVQLGRYFYQVVGVLAPRGYNPIVPVAVDDALLLPLAGLRRVSSAAQPGMLLALAADPAQVEAAAAALQGFLRAQLPRLQVEVQRAEQLLDGMARQSRLFTWLLAGMAALALLVGGVGVMNVMLMNVAERRREIGVRMALGARPQDIAWLFLLEAAWLALAGALLGALLGWLGAWGFTRASGWAFTADPQAVPLGVGTALACGLGFGLQPALAAARLQPVQALADD